MLSPQTWSHRALLTCAEMQRAEELTYAQGVVSFTLMQRAGEAVAKIIQQKWKMGRAVVLCGPGNNGGDGFITAQALRSAGWDVSVGALVMPKELVGNAGHAAEHWQGKSLPLDKITLDKADLIVDALFGTGLTRAVEGAARKVIEKLLDAKTPIVSIDLPSGVNGDTGQILGAAPQATLTVTFFRKKLGHVLLPGAQLCGETVIADIGIQDTVLDQIKPASAENAEDLWLDQFPFPKAEGHKYARGHALIAGGAIMTGATRLAARAAQRIGAGLVTLAAPSNVAFVYSSALESAIVHAADSLDEWKNLLVDPKRNAILIGPGLGIGQAQADFVLAALETKKPIVLDADALGNFSGKLNLLRSKLHPQSVLTPHEGEFARLFGDQIGANLDKASRARKAAEMTGSIVLLKGADTVIAAPDQRAVINTNAPPWLATAGAGDVLAGMILGLLAQDMNPFTATCAAAWMHGATANSFGPGLIAEDLVNGIPEVLKGLSPPFKGV